MKDILADLNPAQQEAVVYHNGPLLVLAGAGSGKTRVLIYRTAWLIAEKKVPPENILLLTFTNKAAGEMKDRLQKILTTNHQPLTTNHQLPYAGTFHSFCAKILRKEGKNIGIPPNYLIYDDQDQIDAVKEILNQLQLSPKEFNPRAVLTLSLIHISEPTRPY